MKRFESVLVVASGDDALPSLMESAIDLAKRNNATITLFDVLEPLAERRRFLRSSVGEIDLEALVAETRIGRTVDVTLWRNSETLTVKVTAAPDSGTLVGDADLATPMTGSTSTIVTSAEPVAVAWFASCAVFSEAMEIGLPSPSPSSTRAAWTSQRTRSLT